MRTERKERTAFFTTKPGVSFCLFFFVSRLRERLLEEEEEEVCVCVVFERMIFFFAVQI